MCRSPSSGNSAALHIWFMHIRHSMHPQAYKTLPTVHPSCRHLPLVVPFLQLLAFIPQLPQTNHLRSRKWGCQVSSDCLCNNCKGKLDLILKRKKHTHQRYQVLPPQEPMHPHPSSTWTQRAVALVRPASITAPPNMKHYTCYTTTLQQHVHNNLHICT